MAKTKFLAILMILFMVNLLEASIFEKMSLEKIVNQAEIIARGRSLTLNHSGTKRKQ